MMQTTLQQLSFFTQVNIASEKQFQKVYTSWAYIQVGSNQPDWQLHVLHYCSRPVLPAAAHTC